MQLSQPCLMIIGFIIIVILFVIDGGITGGTKDRQRLRESRDLPWTCHYCGTQFTSARAYKHHRKDAYHPIPDYARSLGIGSLHHFQSRHPPAAAAPPLLMTFQGRELRDPDQPLADAGIGSEAQVEFIQEAEGVEPAHQPGPLMIFITRQGGSPIVLEVDADSTVGQLSVLASQTFQR